jgi:hypothetical protein
MSGDVNDNAGWPDSDPALRQRGLIAFLESHAEWDLDSAQALGNGWTAVEMRWRDRTEKLPTYAVRWLTGDVHEVKDHKPLPLPALSLVAAAPQAVHEIERDRLVIEVIRADEVQVGDEVVIMEFRDKVTEARPTISRTGIWIELASEEGAELANDSHVLRIAASVADAYEIERDRFGLHYSGPDLAVGDCVRVRPVA